MQRHLLIMAEVAWQWSQRPDRCNIWTICSYKHITFGVSLSLSLTAGLFYLAWPAANRVYSCQMPYTHPNTCQQFASILIHPHSRSLFYFLLLFFFLFFYVFVGSNTWHLLHPDYWGWFWICTRAEDSLQNLIWGTWLHGCSEVRVSVRSQNMSKCVALTEF